MNGFIGRKDELSRLEWIYSRENLHTCAVYGRRRVGKTTLLAKFCEDKPNLTMTVPTGTQEVVLKTLAMRMAEFTGEDVTFQSVHDIIGALSKLGDDRRLVVVIDEFPRLEEAWPGNASLFQEYIDRRLRAQNVLLIVCGSSIGAMNRLLNDGGEPLFERFPLQLKIDPMPYWDARQFHQNLSEADRIRMYAINSGIPMYHDMMSGLGVREGIERNFLEDRALMRGDAASSLSTELKPWPEYDRLLSAIYGGSSTLNEISTRTGYSKSGCYNMLRKLEGLDVVACLTPFGMKKKCIYRITDGFLEFSYSVILGSGLDGQSIAPSVLYEALEDRIASFYGPRFEQVCRQYVANVYRCKSLGTWWGSVPERDADGNMIRETVGDRRRVRTVDVDVDIVAEVVDGEHTDLLLGECEFTGRMTGVREMKNLIDRGEVIRKGSENKRYVLFSRSGFTEELLDYVDERPHLRVDLVSLDDIGIWAEKMASRTPEAPGGV